MGVLLRLLSARVDLNKSNADAPLIGWAVAMVKTAWLVGGLEHFLFSHILGIIIPIDVYIFQRGRVQPPTSNTFSTELTYSNLADGNW